MRVVACLLALGLLLAATPCIAKAPALAEGNIAPARVGEGRGVEPISLADARGKVIVLSFWASWCPPCRKELPVLENIQRAAGKEQLLVVAVNYKEEERLVRRLVGKMGDAQMTFTRDANGTLAKRFGLKALPMMVLIDRAGRIDIIRTGYSEDELDKLLDALNRLLAEPVPEP